MLISNKYWRPIYSFLYIIIVYGVHRDAPQHWPLYSTAFINKRKLRCYQNLNGSKKTRILTFERKKYCNSIWIKEVWIGFYLQFRKSFVTLKCYFWSLLFRSSHFSFLVTLGDEVTKIQNYYVIFVYILLGKMGKTGKNRKLKWPKYQKPKDKNVGWMKHTYIN